MLVNHDFDSPNITQKTFIVTGMSCNGCVTSVERALATQPGVKSANFQLESSEVTIEFDSSIIALDSLQKSVYRVGFELQVPI